MSEESDHDRMRRNALSSPGIRTVRRGGDPVRRGGAAVRRGGAAGDDGAAAPAFDLHYVRTGPRGGTPVVVIPGGPGLASVLPYRGFRKRAAAGGLDVIMVEHRGVGLSRRDGEGGDLPPEALTIASVVDDLDAVLATEHVAEAVIVGSSYGSYVAQAFAATHPERVAAVIVESPMLSANDRTEVAEYQNALLYRDSGATADPGDATTRSLAGQVRSLAAAGDMDSLALGNAVRIVYEFAGPTVLRRFLDQLARGRASRTWRLLTKSSSAEISQIAPYWMEFDLVAEIAFRELGYGEGEARGIFDPARAFEELATGYSSYVGESFDLAAALPGHDFPVLVMVGDRDLRTPMPIAQRIADLASRGRLVVIPAHGHSALDTHVEPLLAAVAALADREGGECTAERAATDALEASGRRRRGGPSRYLGRILSILLRIDQFAPRPRKR